MKKSNHLFKQILFFSIFESATATRLSEVVGGIMRRVCPIAANPSSGCVTSVRKIKDNANLASTDCVETSGIGLLSARKSNAKTYALTFDCIIQRGLGTSVWDSDGKEYLDMLACAGALPPCHSRRGACFSAVRPDPVASGYCDASGTDGEQLALQYIDNALSDPESDITKPALILLEAVQGEGGCIPAPDEWLRGLCEITTRHDVPLAGHLRNNASRQNRAWRISSPSKNLRSTHKENFLRCRVAGASLKGESR